MEGQAPGGRGLWGVRVGNGGKHGSMVATLGFMASRATCTSKGMACWREVNNVNQARGGRACEEVGG